MKKLTAIICALAMFFTFACGAGAAELDFLDKEYQSYDATVEFSMGLNKPLDFISALAREEEIPFDLQYLTESLLKAKFTADIQAETGKDYMSARVAMAVSANVPIEFSEDFSIAVGTKLRLWMDYDFSDKDSLTCSVIFTNPIDGKYCYMDVGDILEENGEEAAEEAAAIVDMMKSLDVKSGVSEITSVVKDVIKGNAKVTAVGNERTIAFSAEAAKKYIAGVLEGVLNSEYMKRAAQAAGGDQLIDEEDLRELKASLDKIKIFADDAIEFKYTLDGKDFAKEAETKLHFAFNIAEICEAFEADEEDIYPLTKENSDVDFTAAAKTVYRSVNNVKVQLPELTEENSVDLSEKFNVRPDEEYDYHTDDYWEEYNYKTTDSFFDYASDAKAIDVSKTEFYIEVEDFFENMSCDADMLDVTVKTDDEGVTVEYSGKDIESAVLKAKIGERTYSVNGASYEAKYPFVLLPGEYACYDEDNLEWKTESKNFVYMSLDVPEKLFGSKVRSYWADIADNGEISYTVTLERPNPGYDENFTGSEETELFLPEATADHTVDVIY